MPGKAAYAARGGVPGATQTNPIGTPRAIGRLQQSDPAANRFQEMLRSLLNPILKRVLLVPPRYVTANLPVAGPEFAGRHIRVKESDTSSEDIRVCLQSSSGEWEWVVLGTSS